MKKKPLPLLTLVLMAFGLNLMLLGTALFFIDSDTPYSGLLALGLFFISLVGVFVVVKVFLVLGKNTYEKHNLDTKPVLVFCFIYLLILLLALLLLHLCVGPIPEEERRDLIVIVAEDKKDETSLPIVIEVEEIEENPPIVEVEEPLPPVDFEIELPEEIVVETEVIALPPSPVIEEVEAVLVPPVPSFTTPEAVVVPSAPTFTSPTEVLVPSAPVFITTEEVLVPSAPVFVSTE